MTEGYDPTRCDLCNGAAADEILRAGAPSLTSDSRIVDLELVKVACRTCGLVRSGSAFDAAALDRHYGTEYTLAVDADRAEPLLPAGDRLVPRSHVFAHWLDTALALGGVAPYRSVLEIGCGEGLLLDRLAHMSPGARASGLELGVRGVEAARRRGLDVRRGGFDAIAGAYDLVVAIAVLEHLPSPRRFFARVAAALTETGTVVVAQPTQDRVTSDVFFVDHLWHFATPHVESLAGTAGLAPIVPPQFDPVVPSFSLHAFARGPAVPVPQAPVPARMDESVAVWRSAFARVDDWLAQRSALAPLAVWGIGQTYDLLQTYSTLRAEHIAWGIDDNLGRFPAGRTPFPVVALEELAQLDPPPEVLLTFPPPARIVGRLQEAALRWFAPLTA